MTRYNKHHQRTIEELSGMVSEDEVFDEATGHKLTSEGVEKKFCKMCGQWHNVEDFWKNNKTIDGLQLFCKHCMRKTYLKTERKASKEEIKVLPQEVINEQIAEDPANEKQFEDAAKILDSLSAYVKWLREQEETQRREKEEWQKRYNDYKDAVAKGLIATKHKLTEKEVVDYINTHSIPPRKLFYAIAKFDPRYVFFCTDTQTGLTSQVKIASA